MRALQEHYETMSAVNVMITCNAPVVPARRALATPFSPSGPPPRSLVLAATGASRNQGTKQLLLWHHAGQQEYNAASVITVKRTHNAPQAAAWQVLATPPPATGIPVSVVCSSDAFAQPVDFHSF